jgi:hypothetical protein
MLGTSISVAELSSEQDSSPRRERSWADMAARGAFDRSGRQAAAPPGYFDNWASHHPAGHPDAPRHLAHRHLDHRHLDCGHPATHYLVILSSELASAAKDLTLTGVQA